MFIKAAVGVVGVILCVANPPAFQAKPVTAATGEPRLLETGAGISFAMTEDEYQKLAAQLTKMAAFVPMTKKPDGLSPRARFGINFTLEHKNCSWALDGDDTSGYVLYADVNGNGDLSDDTPMRFELKDGKYSYLFKTNSKADPGHDLDTFPVMFKLVVDMVSPPDGATPKLALRRYGNIERRGNLALGSAPMLFRIGGSGGTYDEGYNSISFDLNGDGTLDPKTESYLISEKYVNIGDVTYEYAVDRYGRSVTLTPLAEKRPPRVLFVAGYPAPDFSFTDLDGKARKLSDYRGKVVLIDFWGTWCGPCLAAIPELVAAYEKFHGRGFEIVGVDQDEKRELLQTFVTEKKLLWPQAFDGAKGPIVSLYRITGFPSYFLLDKDGKFAVVPGGATFDLDAELSKLLMK